MLYGLVILAVLGIMGGVIAYVGDKLGTRIGKRKITLFGLRPKHTSILVTIVTGMLIAATTLGVMSILSENVRVALFGMQQLKAEMASLTNEIDVKNKALEAGKLALDRRNEELKKLGIEVQEKSAELDEVQAAYEGMHGELMTVQQAYSYAQSNLLKAQGEIKDLETTKAELNKHIENLQVQTKRLEEGIVHIREGQVLFRVGEVLSGAVVKPNLTEAEAGSVLTSIINDTNGLILMRINSTDQNKEMILVSKTNFDEAARVLAAAKEPVLVRLLALGNIIYGEPAVARIEILPYVKVYESGDTVWEATVMAGAGAESAILSFLREVNNVAKARGVLPDPITNEIGSISNLDLAKAIEEVTLIHGGVKLEAIAIQDVYTEGPVRIRLRVTRP